MAGEKAIITCLSPIFWIKNKLSNTTGGPVGFLSTNDREILMSNLRITAINPVPGLFNDNKIEIVLKDRYPVTRERIVISVKLHSDMTYTISQPTFSGPGNSIMKKRKMKGYTSHIPKDLQPLLDEAGCTSYVGIIDKKLTDCNFIMELLAEILKMADLCVKIVEAA